MIRGLTLSASLALLLIAGCPWLGGNAPLNPFTDLPDIPFDAQPHLLSYDVAPLGQFDAGTVIRVQVSGAAIDAVLILMQDDQEPEAGLIVGGGPANSAFDYRVPAADRYFVYVLFNPAATGSGRQATLTAGPGDASYRPPSRQIVRVLFEDGYLTNPGLVDPESFTDDERQVLVDVSGLVREEVLTRLQTIFAGTPIEIQSADDPLPNEPWSPLAFLAERKLAGPGDQFDTALPPLIEGFEACQDVVVFGEVLPGGTLLDPGNHMLDDEAVVYVGSFQGRGLDCRSAALNSVSSIVLGLSHTAAHEIGHLVGLFHVPLTDIMNRSPTLAFERELVFDRQQLLIEGGTQTQVLTTVIQDPARYFEAIFTPVE